QVPQPADLAALPGEQVQVGHVQHPDRVGAGGQHRSAHLAHGERLRLDQRPGQSGRARGTQQSGGPAQRPGRRLAHAVGSLLVVIVVVVVVATAAIAAPAVVATVVVVVVVVVVVPVVIVATVVPVVV